MEIFKRLLKHKIKGGVEKGKARELLAALGPKFRHVNRKVKLLLEEDFNRGS